MKEAERAFSDADYDRAEHLAKVVAYLVQREAPKFAANPKAWIDSRSWTPTIGGFQGVYYKDASQSE
jgi:hypothetical protein